MNNLARVTELQTSNKKVSSQHQYSQLSVYYDAKYKAGWYYMHASPRPCFTAQLLDEITDYQKSVQFENKYGDSEKYDYIIAASSVDNVFNLGETYQHF
ncbi:hypothetical protein [Psychromonas sp. KJ10-2]|uniref:hypothetical protein n=1 Tax=Psychromonas sp. KJ10-2 TaxID=3391822 RepID=UPI0039B4EAE7